MVISLKTDSNSRVSSTSHFKFLIVSWKIWQYICLNLDPGQLHVLQLVTESHDKCLSIYKSPVCSSWNLRVEASCSPAGVCPNLGFPDCRHMVSLPTFPFLLSFQPWLEPAVVLLAYFILLEHFIGRG